MTPTSQLILVLRNGLVLTIFLEGMRRAGLPEGLFLALAILVVLEADFGGGVIAGRERMLGSVLGLLSVVVTAGVSATIPLPAKVFAGLMLVRLFSFSAGLSSGYIVGGHVVAGSLLHHPNDWWDYAFWRTLMTILGVGIGVLISRHVYSQRSVSSWRNQCSDWIQDLRDNLIHLESDSNLERHYQELRERRNDLRRNLPKLIAEQRLTHNRQDNVQWAQIILQHGSSVMSCCRDLNLLINDNQPIPDELAASTAALQDLGQQRLQDLFSNKPAFATSQAFEAVEQRLQSDINAYLKSLKTDLDGDMTPQATSSSRRSHLLATRLLLLSDALGQLPTREMPRADFPH